MFIQEQIFLTMFYSPVYFKNAVQQGWIRCTRYERALWDGLSCCLRDLCLLSSMFSIQAFVSAALAQMKIFESTIGPRVYHKYRCVRWSNIFVTLKLSYSGLIQGLIFCCCCCIRGALTSNLKHMWRTGVLLWDLMNLNGWERKDALWQNTDGSLMWSLHH